jgi:uncharacterized cupredoxin-like copper-binding protein
MSNQKSNIGWYIAAVVVVVVIIVVGVVSYELTLPSQPSTSASASPSSTPTSPPSTSSASPSSTSSPSSTPSSSGSTQSLTLYAGSVTSGSGTYGFGDSSSNIVSPGPTLNLKVGTTYTMTVNNVGNIPHSWEIVQTKAVGTPMFGAGIDVNNYISPGSSGSVTFTPDQSGSFYYVCTVPGHISLGMWGNVNVSG